MYKIKSIKMKISIAYMRDLEREVALEKITFSRMVELLNERANEPETKSKEPIVSSQVYEPEYVLKLVESYFGPGCAVICAERLRQMQVEGWDHKHDDICNECNQLSLAAVSYLLPDTWRDNNTLPPTYWPWNRKWWKPTPDSRIKELGKGGALTAAEIDRLKRKGKES
jgi:hypothetical protein